MQQIPRFDPWVVRGTIIAPCVLAIAQLLWVIAISDRLPEQIATHWSGSDTPNGFMPPIQSTLIMAVVVIACAQIGWIGAKTSTPLVVRKPIAIINLALCGFLIALEFAIIIPQIGTTNPTTARISWVYAIVGVVIGLAAALLVARRLRDYSSLTDATVTEPTSPELPHREGDPTPIDVSVTISNGVKVAFTVWCVASIALAVFLPSLGIVFLLCTPLFLIAYETGMTLDTNPMTDSITVFNGCGPLKMKHHIELRTIKYAKPGKYNWADGGGIGLRLGNDGRITVAARSGEAVKIETSGANYTIVVADGTSSTVAGEINSRIDAMR
ncbi:DUF1648 domain-containing protein [Corynebacterium vitaeruminis]|uniref:DUF1648 domain-containing protein n=1 Tax=Corynebacterium vitaeruminis TaxID=38305 RepID=UPI0006616F3A|nr:DUF1648 domain-containing protein [Corynebacterium vitaeruminis]